MWIDSDNLSCPFRCISTYLLLEVIIGVSSGVAVTMTTLLLHLVLCTLQLRWMLLLLTPCWSTSSSIRLRFLASIAYHSLVAEVHLVLLRCDITYRHWLVLAPSLLSSCSCIWVFFSLKSKILRCGLYLMLNLFWLLVFAQPVKWLKS